VSEQGALLPPRRRAAPRPALHPAQPSPALNLTLDPPLFHAEARVRELEDQLEIRARAEGKPLPQRTFSAPAPAAAERKPPAPRVAQPTVDVISLEYINPGWKDADVYIHFNADGQGALARSLACLHP
jgi:hypothetical protein